MLLEQARFLADQFHSGTVNRHYEPQFINLYSSTWKAIADWYATDPETFAKATVPEFLVVRWGSELLVAAPGTADTPPICVRDNDDEVAPGLISAAGDAILEVKGADPARVGVLFVALYGDRVRLVSGLRYDVRADNVPIDELPRDPTALDVCACLRPMAAFTIEALTGIEAGQLPTDRSSLLARLGNVGLQFAIDVEIELNGTVISPSGRRRTYLFRRADSTPLVVALHGGPVTWAVVEDCLQAICEAMDLPQIATRMRLLARDLDAAGTAVGEKEIEHADLELLGRTLDLDEHALASAHRLLGDQLDASRSWIRAVVHLVGGADALDTFDREVGAVGDPNLLRIVLAPLLAPAGMSSDKVIDACRRSFTTENLRALGIHVRRLQREPYRDRKRARDIPTATRKPGPPLRHRSRSRDHPSVADSVAKKLERREAAPEYVQLRHKIRSITPDPAWLPLYKNAIITLKHGLRTPIFRV